MFKKQVKNIDELLKTFIRNEGLETPLLQKRAVDAWDKVVGITVSRYCTDKFIKNQILYVKVINPALRQDLSMMRSQLTRRINEEVGSNVISEVRVY
ncbi:MAG: DUF721 domain-containing protein [Prevotella sp.]|jgi:predicted nucleic acid-binding Zn ribbon protein